MKVRRLIFAIALLGTLFVSAVQPTSAQESTSSPQELQMQAYESAQIAVKRPKFEPQHEIRLTVGAFPICENWYIPTDETIRKGSIYTAGAWTLSYAYRFRKWIDAGVALTYYGEYTSLHDNFDNSLIERLERHRIAIMPSVRFTWVNRELVRLYSTLNIGILFDSRRETSTLSRTDSAAQCTPIGIAVGRSLFGFAEIGFGTQGIFMAGIGYNFNYKSSKK